MTDEDTIKELQEEIAGLKEKMKEKAPAPVGPTSTTARRN